MFKRQKQQQQIRKGNNRWADDDEDTSNNTNNIPSKTNINTPSFIKTSNYSNSSSTFNKPLSNNNYQPSSSHPKKDTRFALEKKLIDDILQPTGIKIKPDEKLMVDFCRRAKNLDRTLIYSYLMEKISPYKSYLGNTDKMNMLIKCLYLISYILDSKIQDLFEVFSDNQQIFIDMKSTFGNNRKIIELTEQILQFLGVEVNHENDDNDYQNFENNNNNVNNQQENQISNNNANNVDLLDFDSGDKNNNGNNTTGNINLLEDIFQNDGNANTNNTQANNTNDLLGGIFGTNETNNINNNQNINSNFPSDIFGAPSQNINQINNPNSFFENIQQNTNNPKTNQVSNQPKGFNFIKKGDSSNINNPGNQNKPVAKKGFSFIKPNNNSNNNSNQTKENQIMNNDLDNIFNNAPQSSTPQQNFNQGFNVNQLENIFNLPSNDNSNNNQEAKIPTLVAQKPEFNINQVYQNTTQLQKELKPNDPFNFVDDLFKKK